MEKNDSPYMDLEAVLSRIHLAAVDAQVSLLGLAQIANERLHLRGMMIIVAKRLVLHPIRANRLLLAPPRRGCLSMAIRQRAGVAHVVGLEGRVTMLQAFSDRRYVHLEGTWRQNLRDDCRRVLGHGVVW